MAEQHREDARNPKRAPAPNKPMIPGTIDATAIPDVGGNAITICCG
jgi:hypothetical protein